MAYQRGHQNLVVDQDLLNRLTKENITGISHREDQPLVRLLNPEIQIKLGIGIIYALGFHYEAFDAVK